MTVSPTDTNEKCVAGQGNGYRGTWSISGSGAECINWNATSLRGRKFTARKVDASSLGLGNHNFCRYVLPVYSAKGWNICRSKLQIFSVPMESLSHCISLHFPISGTLTMTALLGVTSIEAIRLSGISVPCLNVLKVRPYSELVKVKCQQLNTLFV